MGEGNVNLFYNPIIRVLKPVAVTLWSSCNEAEPAQQSRPTTNIVKKLQAYCINKLRKWKLRFIRTGTSDQGTKWKIHGK